MSTTIPPIEMRVAGAPISWGVCEVPGWGWQYDASTVLAQMAEVGLAATEFGPDGFLPADPQAKADLLTSQGLKAVGQFVPVVLHDPGHDPLPEVERAMEGLVAARASTVVLAAATGQEGYDARPVLDDAGWQTLLGNLDRLKEAAAARGLTATLHPHVGTMVESGEETDRVLAGSSIGLCLDTGHLLIGGGDPVAVAQGAPRPDRPHPPQGRPPRLGPSGPVRRGDLHRGRGRWDVRAPRRGRRRHRRDRQRARGRRVCRVVRARAGHHPHGRPQPVRRAPTGPGARRDVRTSLYYLLGVAAQRSGVGV